MQMLSIPRSSALAILAAIVVSGSVEAAAQEAAAEIVTEVVGTSSVQIGYFQGGKTATLMSGVANPLAGGSMNSTAGLPGVNDILTRSLSSQTTVCDSSNGNYWSRIDRFTNTSADLLVRIDGVQVKALDPTTLGFPNVENSNGTQAQAAAIAAFPDFPFWGISWWVGDDPPQVSYPLVQIINATFTCTVGPGESFELTTHAHNNHFSCASASNPTDFGELAIGWVFLGEVVEGCAGTLASFGAGTEGTGAKVPVLAASECPVPGGRVTLDVTNGSAQALGCLFVGHAQAATPAYGGTFLIAPPIDATFFHSLSHSGTASKHLRVPLNLGGQTFYLQGAYVDAGAQGGVSLTNGLQVTIQSIPVSDRRAVVQ